MDESIKILYVEDNPADARLLKEYLKESRGDYRCHTAASLAEALDYLTNNSVDIVLADLSLPDSQGGNTFRRIHAQSQRTPILVLSGLADEEVALKTVHEGAQDYLVKGRFDRDVLDRAIRYALERDRAAKALRESERRYQNVGEMVPFGVWTADTDGGVIYLSDVFLDMVGMSLDQCKGFGWTRQVHPEDAQEMIESWKECIRDETPWDHEHRIRDRFGDYRTVLSRGMPVRGVRGQVISWSGINLDITGRKGYEEALRQSEETYRAMFEDSLAVTLLIDPDSGRIIDANEAACAFYGYSREQLLDIRIMDINTLSESEIRKELELARSQKKAYFNFKHRLAGGEIRDVEVYSGSISIRGRILVYSIIHDITDRMAAERAQRQSEEKYRLVVETVNSVITVNQDGLIRFVNDRITDLLGYSPHEVIGNKVGFLVDDQDREATLKWAAGWASGEPTPRDITLRLRHKNGELRHVQVSTSLMMWEGRPALLNSATDITERVRAEVAVQVSETKYRRLFEAAKDGILILDADTGKIVDVNPYLSSMLGYSDEELLGKRLWEIGLFKDIAANRDGFRRLQDEEYIRYEDLPLQTKDGRSISVEFVSNVYQVDHTKVVQCNIRDITERKRAEQALKEAHANLKQALKAATAGTWDWDIVHNTFIWSEEFREIFGMDQNATAGFEAWKKAVHPEDREEASRKIQDAVDKKEDLTNDYRIVLPGGKIRWIRAVGRTFYDQSVPLRMAGLCIDITDRKQAEEQLRRNAGINAALAELYEPLTSPGATIHDITTVVLNKALEITRSAHGYVAEIDPLSGDSLVHAITDMFPKQRKALGENQRLRFPVGSDGRYGGLWGHALNTRKAFFTNSPKTHPASKGVPKGHEHIERFLSVPVLLGTELVGQIALARPQRDYSEHDLEAVRRLAVFYALAIQRVRAEETILQSLAEKEALLREIHHRVKNNLQTVSSLLSMAQMGAKNTEASDLLRDAESRVHAMALIHSQLYGTRQLDRIDVKRNIRELTDRLSSIYSAPMHHIVQSVEGDDVFLSIHQAIPVALAINEVVINAYKYAFAGRSAGTIHVSVVHGKDTASITIADNGIGLPPDFDVEKTETLGLRLVKNLIEGQLGGRVDFASRKGAKITMSFKTDGRERIHAEKDYR